MRINKVGDRRGGKFKHGMCGTPTYNSWSCMIQRCRGRTKKNFRNYVMRGIKVCDEWFDFATFLRDMGPRPSLNHSLDRIDNDGNYEPGNCRWATDVEQCANMRKNRKYPYNGEVLCLAEIARREGVGRNVITGAMRDGRNLQEVLDSVREGRNYGSNKPRQRNQYSHCAGG